jgi:hypothetical protein
MALTGLAVYTDKVEYSRYWDGDEIITVAVVPTPADLANPEIVRVKLVRSWNNAEVWSQDITFPSGTGVQPILVKIDLRSVNEILGSVSIVPFVDASLGGPAQPTAESISLVRTGYHEIIVTQGNISARSGQFFVGIITPTRLKNQYTFGLSTRTRSILAVKQQPKIITGVSALAVSDGTLVGFHVLDYKNTAKTLSWDGGVAQSISTAPLSKMLLPSSDTTKYLEVSIAYSSLPAADKTESLLIEEAPFSSDLMAGHILTAISDVSDRMNIFVEPMRVATDPYWTGGLAGDLLFKVPFDLKAYAPAWWPDSFRMEALAWHIDLPFRQLQWVQGIRGFITNRMVVQLADNGITKIGRTGYVDVLPFDAKGMTTFWTFYGLYPYSLFARTHLTNFWRYAAIVGFNETPKSVIEVVAKKAAIDVLTQVVQAMSGGYESFSISKDGVSQSVSMPVIRKTIEEYQDHLSVMIPSLSQKYGGITVRWV